MFRHTLRKQSFDSIVRKTLIFADYSAVLSARAIISGGGGEAFGSGRLSVECRLWLNNYCGYSAKNFHNCFFVVSNAANRSSFERSDKKTRRNVNER